MKITKEDRDLLLFMIIGDGTINKNGYVAIRHCVAQRDYIQWKKSLLKFNTTDCYYVNNNGYGAYEFRTKIYKFLKLYRKVIYPNSNKKIANKKLLSKLTPLGLSIWYMDDGGLSQKKRNGKIHANELMLNTYLSKEENQVIIDYFMEKWGIKFSQVKSKNHYRLRCGTQEARKFIEIVKPFVSLIPSMSHKINILNSKISD